MDLLTFRGILQATASSVESSVFVKSLHVGSKLLYLGRPSSDVMNSAHDGFRNGPLMQFSSIYNVDQERIMT